MWLQTLKQKESNIKYKVIMYVLIILGYCLKVIKLRMVSQSVSMYVYKNIIQWWADYSTSKSLEICDKESCLW